MECGGACIDFYRPINEGRGWWGASGILNPNVPVESVVFSFFLGGGGGVYGPQRPCGLVCACVFFLFRVSNDDTSGLSGSE